MLGPSSHFRGYARVDKPTGQEPTEVVAEEPSASVAEQESENGFMNRLIRGVGRIFQADDEDSAGDREQEAEPQATQPKVVTLTEDELNERVNRQAQAEADRRETARAWDHALRAADAEDYGPLAELAASGNRKAERELAKRGATSELGEARGRAVQTEEQTDAERERLTVIAGGFDEALLAPLLAAVSDEARDKILGDGIAGLEGRKSAAEQAIAAIRSEARKEAATKLLDDEKFVKDLLGDTTFRQQLLKNPVTNKQLRAFFRGELDEPDLIPGSGRGQGGERENDVMNDGIRAAWLGADSRADDERAAGAGARTRGGSNRDLLDDD